jgi:hypothetical protein
MPPAQRGKDSMTALTVLAQETKHELPLPSWAIGLIAFGILVALLLITLQFNRDR